MLPWLSIAIVLAASVPAIEAHAPDEFTLSTFQPARLVDEPVHHEYTDNVVQLQRGNSVSFSSSYLAAIRAGNHVDGVYTRIQSTNASLTEAEAGAVFLAPLVAGNQTFLAVLDTGSSDTWLVETNYTCAPIDVDIPCAFGSGYINSTTVHFVPDQNFNISYQDGELLNGRMATENLTFANIPVSQQKIGLVSLASWLGDGASSGLIGLAYSTLTHAYPGTDPSADKGLAAVTYPTLFETIYTRNLTAPLFSLALQRYITSTNSKNGGVLALGGIPSIPHGRHWARAPIAIVSAATNSHPNIYQFYTVTLDGFALSNSSSAIFDTSPNSTARNPRYTPLVATNTSIILDSGTSLIFAPASVASALAALYSPPASFDPTTGFLAVACGARPPALFGLVVQAKVFYVNPLDLVVRVQEGYCVAGVQAAGAGGTPIAGAAWLRNVLVAFDVGAAEVRVAAREWEDAVLL